MTDTTDVHTLFQLINVIANTLITQPKQTQELYDNLPEGARKAIEKRDSKNLITWKRINYERHASIRQRRDQARIRRFHRERMKYAIAVYSCSA